MTNLSSCVIGSIGLCLVGWYKRYYYFDQATVDVEAIIQQVLGKLTIFFLPHHTIFQSMLPPYYHRSLSPLQRDF